MTVRAAERERFRAALTNAGSVRVPLPRIWLLWAEAAERLVGTGDQAGLLRAVLDDFAADGTIELPKTTWDRSTVPALPASVTVPSARGETRDRQWQRFPWRAELGWVASLPSLPSNRFEDLRAINDWLGRRESRTVVPVRYRSVELFGNEKHLDQMERTTLFGPGRLDLRVLDCERLAPPLPASVVGDGADVLVVENADTYWAAQRAARTVGGPVGVVAWGSGRTFPVQATSLTVDVAGRGPVRGHVWYWGDLDPAGVVIATDAATAAHAAGLEVRAATGLWRAFADCPAQNVGEVSWPEADAARVRWFGQQVWDTFEPVRARSGRVAQEAVSAAVVTDWMQAPF